MTETATEQLTSFAEALTDVAAAAERVPDPVRLLELALEFFRGRSEPPRAAPAPRLRMTVGDDGEAVRSLVQTPGLPDDGLTYWSAEAIGEKLVIRGGIDLRTATKAAQRAIEELGSSAPVDDLVRRARELAPARPKAPGGKRSGPSKPSEKPTKDLVNYLRRHGPTRMLDLCTWAGVSRATMTRRVKGALQAGLIERAGDTYRIVEAEGQAEVRHG